MPNVNAMEAALALFKSINCAMKFLLCLTQQKKLKETLSCWSTILLHMETFKSKQRPMQKKSKLKSTMQLKEMLK
jgi:hypothetical protein